MDTKALFFGILRGAVTGEELSREIRTALPASAVALFKLAVPQGLAAMVGQKLADEGLLEDDNVGRHFRESSMRAFARHGKQQYEFARICSCLDQLQIAYIPLKGAVTREYYPQGWLRTSTDIDILVRERDLEAAVRGIINQLGYTQPGDREYHDVALYSPNGVLLELHFSLRENQPRWDALLDKVWEHAAPRGDGTCRWDMDREFFVYHNVAHCAYHLTASGCGARSILDLWLLKNKMGYREQEVKALCRDCGLERFYEQIMALAQAWFADGPETPFLEALGDYVLGAGFGGSKENMVAAGILKKRGKLRYFWSRVFLPGETLRASYPILEKHRVLTPVFQVRRWVDKLANRRLGPAVRELNACTTVDGQSVGNTADILRELDLLDNS